MRLFLRVVGLLLLSGFFAACVGSKGMKETAMDESVSRSADEQRTPPGAPAGLRLVVVSSGIRLAWSLSLQDPGSVTGYEIVRATIFSGPYEVLARVDKGVFTYTDTTAAAENIYFYKVRSMAGDLYSPFSREAAGEIPGVPGN